MWSEHEPRGQEEQMSSVWPWSSDDDDDNDEDDGDGLMSVNREEPVRVAGQDPFLQRRGVIFSVLMAKQ